MSESLDILSKFLNRIDRHELRFTKTFFEFLLKKGGMVRKSAHGESPYISWYVGGLFNIHLPQNNVLIMCSFP